MVDDVGRVVGPTRCCAATEEPFAEHVVGCLEGEHGVQRDAEVEGELVGLVRLVQVAGEAVEEVATFLRRLDERVAEHRLEQLVGDEIPAAEIVGDGAAELGVLGDLGAQHVTGREVTDAVVGREPLALRALAGTGRREEEEPHGPKPRTPAFLQG